MMPLSSRQSVEPRAVAKGVVSLCARMGWWWCGYPPEEASMS
jgi:hypothetical protein